MSADSGETPAGTADASVVASLGEYFGLDRNVISPAWALFATPSKAYVAAKLINALLMSLAVVPTVAGEFRAPWVTSTGYGTIARTGKALAISCVAGTLGFQKLQVDLANPATRVGARNLTAKASQANGVTTLEFASAVSLTAGQTLTLQ